jgi:hypothetical protein
MDGVTGKLECEVSLDVVVTEDCCKISIEVYIGSIGSREGQKGRAGTERTEVFTLYVQTRHKTIKWKQDFVNHKIVLAVKTVCSMIFTFSPCMLSHSLY